jgi:TolB-like protein/Flp pilus assembly protein TadD
MRDRVADFSLKLTLLLKRINCSRGGLASAIGVDKSLIGRWVTGTVYPTDHNLVRVTQFAQRYLPDFNLLSWDQDLATFAQSIGASFSDLVQNGGEHSIADQNVKKGSWARALHPTRYNWLAAAGLLVLTLAAISWQNGWLGEFEVPRQEPGALPRSDVPSIAVLPFTNTGGDGGDAYFAEGIAEDVITDLSKVSGLFVIARNSSFAFRQGERDVQAIARRLGARYIMDGSVRRSGERVRINVRLIDSATGGNLWAERFDGGLSDVFGLQDEITRKIVGVLAVRLTAAEQQQLVRREASNPEAYDAFLQGWRLYRQQTRGSLQKAADLFARALALDPAYGRAHAALAASYWQVWRRYWAAEFGFPRAHDALFRAEESLVRAMEHPTTLALQLRVEILSQRGQHGEAIAEGERTVALDPNDADGHVALAGALSLAGRADEALPHIHRAMRLNPLYPPNYLYQLGLAQFVLGQLEQAAEALERAAALNPEDRWSLRLLLATYGLLGRDGTSDLLSRAQRSFYGMDALTVSAVSFWYPFRNEADAARLRMGLSKAGVPH